MFFNVTWLVIISATFIMRSSLQHIMHVGKKTHADIKFGAQYCTRHVSGIIFIRYGESRKVEKVASGWTYGCTVNLPQQKRGSYIWWGRKISVLEEKKTRCEDKGTSE